jgi:hypothetical protein
MGEEEVGPALLGAPGRREGHQWPALGAAGERRLGSAEEERLQQEPAGAEERRQQDPAGERRLGSAEERLQQGPAGTEERLQQDPAEDRRREQRRRGEEEVRRRWWPLQGAAGRREEQQRPALGVAGRPPRWAAAAGPGRRAPRR